MIALYVVYWTDRYGDRELSGIFTTQQKAETYIAGRQDPTEFHWETEGVDLS